MRILHVDDEPAMIHCVRRLLGAEGHEVAGAADAEQALDRLQDETFDAVLLDVLMPGIDGLRLLRTLRCLFPDLPVLILTGLPDSATWEEALAAGCEGFLLKPFQAVAFVAQVNAVLAQHPPRPASTADRRHGPRPSSRRWGSGGRAS